MSYLFQDRAIHVIAEPEDDRLEATSIDIIALHGLGGSWDDSWKLDGYCWLAEALAPRYRSSRIISLDYPSLLGDLASATSPTDIDTSGLVLDIIRDRHQHGRDTTAIVFMGHSFGGTLLKSLYVATHPSNTPNPDFHRFHRLIRGFVFLGTPQRDLHAFPDVAKLWRALSAEAATTMGAKSPDLEKALFATSAINHAFERVGGQEVPVLCFHEKEKTLVGLQKMYIVTQKEATSNGRDIEAIPLNVRHQALGKYGQHHDNNLQRILEAFETFMAKLQDPQVRTPILGTRRTQRRLKLLSLDGGGVRGYFTILVIQRLIDRAHQLEGGITASAKRPCDYFDLIGGTSTGGLLAIMLGRLQMDTGSCIRAYRSLSKQVFYRNSWLQFLRPFHTVGSMVLGYPWFSGDLLKSVICQTLHDHLSAHERESLREDGGQTIEDIRLLSHPISTPISSMAEQHCARCFVCAVPAKERKVERLRSYRSINLSAHDTTSYTIWEAARATSAAPMYFPAITVQGTKYFDGGLASNNPVVEVIEEARLEFPPDAVIDTIVSIGTGRGTIPDPVPPVTNIVNHFIFRSTDTEGQHDRVMTDPAFDDVRDGYFRFQTDTDLGDIDLADAERLDDIERLANKYLDSPAGRHMIASCAARLVGS